MEQSPQAELGTEPGRRLTVGIVAALLLVFAGLSFSAIRTKSATFDEPVHLLGSLMHRFVRDFRANPEDPAIFGWWASLPHGAGVVEKEALNLDPGKPGFALLAKDLQTESRYCADHLYARGAEFADGLLNRSRFMFLLLGIALGALVAGWAYQLAGPWAAIVACALYSFDANFLAHSSILKNDVGASLMMCLLTYLLWRSGRDGRWYWLVSSSLVCAVAINLKFSGVLLLPIMMLVLAARVILPKAWNVAGLELDAIASRALVVLVVGILTALATYAVTWAAYGFRYSATADGTPLATDEYVMISASTAIHAQIIRGEIPDMSSDAIRQLAFRRVRRGELALPVQLNVWMQTHHLLPEGWLFGFLTVCVTTLLHPGYLLGETRLNGWWYYFPFAILVKTPTATLAAIVVVPITCAAAWFRRAIPRADRIDWWTPVAMTIPPAFYFLMAMRTSMNLGVRHVLCIYPFIFIGIAVCAATLIRRWHTLGLIGIGLLLATLVAESVATYPNYIAYFNLPSGGNRAALNLLGDSNLDWGQDLPALAQWQHAHPKQKLYLAYFGAANPGAYGIDFVNLPGGYDYSPQQDFGPEPGVVAISATLLQGVVWTPEGMAMYLSRLAPLQAHRIDMLPSDAEKIKALPEALRRLNPREVINGSIYLFDWPPKE